MSDDKKLPATRPPTSVSGRDEYLSSPVRGRSLIGRAVSRWIAGLNTRTVKANTEEIRALTEYARERGMLADATLDAERRIAHYMFDRDEIIDDDRETHRDQMEEQKFQRELNRRRREETLRALDADANQSASQRDYNARIAQERNEASLSQAKWEASRAKWGHDAFEQSLPLRKDRIQHLYSTGAMDKEIEMLITEADRDRLLRDHASRSPSPSHSNSGSVSVIDQLIDETDKEIELARATHAPDDVLSYLYAMRSRLSAKRAELNGD